MPDGDALKRLHEAPARRRALEHEIPRHDSRAPERDREPQDDRKRGGHHSSSPARHTSSRSSSGFAAAFRRRLATTSATVSARPGSSRIHSRNADETASEKSPSLRNPITPTTRTPFCSAPSTRVSPFVTPHPPPRGTAAPRGGSRPPRAGAAAPRPTPPARRSPPGPVARRPGTTRIRSPGGVPLISIIPPRLDGSLEHQASRTTTCRMEGRVHNPARERPAQIRPPPRPPPPHPPPPTPPPSPSQPTP